MKKIFAQWIEVNKDWQGTIALIDINYSYREIVLRDFKM